MFTSVNVSIIIPVYNNFQYTKTCIENIFKNSGNDVNYEIIIVDNCSQDETQDELIKLQQELNTLKYFRLDRNYKFAYACNYGAKKSNGNVLVFLNNDTIPLNGWLIKGIKRLLSDDNIGIVGSKLLYPDFTIQHCGIDFFKDTNNEYFFWPLHRYLKYPNDHPLVNKSEEVIAVTGACLFIKKNLFEEVNFFDENYEMYFEDLDLCFKIRKKGYKIFYESQSVLIHYESQSIKDRNIIDQLNKEAAKKFFARWKKDVYYYMLQRYFEYHDEKFTIIKKDIYPVSLLNDNYKEDVEKSTKDYLIFLELLNSVGEVYVHFGGAGDALLLLSTFYDNDPEQIVLSFANSVKAIKSFFESFPALKHVYILPIPTNNLLHSTLRKILPRLQNVKGMGVTPKQSYAEEWSENTNIFIDYKINPKPKWAKSFASKKIEHFQVTIAPKGSLFGMVGSKKNIMSFNDWKHTIKYFTKRGIKPIILGTPDEAKDYPVLYGAIDKRSYSFQEQMKLIASSDLFIGADSWGKTFSALAGIKTFVFKPLRGPDLKDWIDNSEYIFIRPWKEITLVENFNQLRTYLNELPELNRDVKIVIDGPLKISNSLTIVNLELANQFIKNGYDLSLYSLLEIDKNLFINKDYQNFRNLINKEIKSSDIYISHYFPPRISKPKTKKWIAIQPWEFGSIPKFWVDLFNNEVDEVWVPSNFVKNIFIHDGIDENKVFVIPNGINDKFIKSEHKYHLSTKKSVKFLFVGGTIYRKGIDVLLKAYTLAFTKNDDVCLIIKDVGTESVYKGRNYNQQILQIMNLDNVPEIIYINKNLSIEELVALYNTCDFLVHPYRGEGFGLPILEAMACGLIPIVTSNGATDDFCNEFNSIKINSTKKYLSDNRIDNFETVNTPWLLEPDLDHLVQILQYVYKNVESIKMKYSHISNEIRNVWSWGNSFIKMQQRIIKLLFNGAKESIYELKTDFDEIIKNIDSEIKNNNYDEALNIILNSIQKLDSKGMKCTLFDIAGNLYLLKNDLLNSQKYFEEELNLDPQSSSACYGLGQVFFAQQNFEAAKIMFEWAVKNNPQNIAAKNALEKVNELLGYELSHSSLEGG